MQYNLRSLQVFEAVYRHRSIKDAAVELSITPSAISHQLRHLRTEIGEDLITKHGRHISFTPYGEKMAESLKFAFAFIDQTVRATITSEPSSIRVAVCTAFGSGWLVPRLPSYPGLSGANVQIILHANQPELTDAVADIFFTTTPMKDGYTSIRILAEDLVAVYSPSIKGMIEDKQLITTDLNHTNFAEDWAEYSSAVQRQHEIKGLKYCGASHYMFATQMAERGLGIALVPDFLAEDGIRRGTLMLWSDHRMSTGRSYFMNVKYARRNEAPVKQFMQWVRNTAMRPDRSVSGTGQSRHANYSPFAQA